MGQEFKSGFQRKATKYKVMNLLTFDIKEWYIEQHGIIGKDAAFNDVLKREKISVVKF